MKLKLSIFVILAILVSGYYLATQEKQVTIDNNTVSLNSTQNSDTEISRDITYILSACVLALILLLLYNSKKKKQLPEIEW
jgi:ABC-type branched-subunit amino acid transport system permease subunit